MTSGVCALEKVAAVHATISAHDQRRRVVHLPFHGPAEHLEPRHVDEASPPVAAPRQEVGEADLVDLAQIRFLDIRLARVATRVMSSGSHRTLAIANSDWRNSVELLDGAPSP